MGYQNDDLFEWFEVLFGKKSCIVAGKEYPLGYFAAEALEIDDALLAELKDLTQRGSAEFHVFLNARTASSAGMAVQELDRAWALIKQLPLYNKIPYWHGKRSAVSDMIHDLREDAAKHDRMLTVGTRENELLRRWQGRYSCMADDIKRFQYDVDDMLTDFFEELPSRRPEAYAAAFEECMESFREIYSQTEDKDDLAYMDERKDNFPVNISFEVERNQKTGLPFIAEK